MNAYIVLADAGNNTIEYGIDVKTDLLGVFCKYEDAKAFVLDLVNDNDRPDDEHYTYYSGCFSSLGEDDPLPIFEDPETEILDDEFLIDGSCAVLSIIEVPMNQRFKRRIAGAFYVE